MRTLAVAFFLVVMSASSAMAATLFNVIIHFPLDPTIHNTVIARGISADTHRSAYYKYWVARDKSLLLSDISPAYAATNVCITHRVVSQFGGVRYFYVKKYSVNPRC